mgnify:FL=1
MTPHERKIARDYLTRRKRTLQRQGANNNEIKAYLGGRWNFAGMSDKALERAYHEVKSKGKTKVFGGHVYSQDYVKKAKEWYGDKFAQEKLTQGYRNSKKSKLNRFNDVKEVRAYKSKRDREAKERYINALEDMFINSSKSTDKNEIKKFNALKNRINRMSASNFGKFLTGGASDKVSFERVMVFIKTDDSETAFEFQESLAGEILDNVDRFSRQFLNDMKRMKKRKAR